MENSLISYFIWNWNSVIFSTGGLTLRWSALLFVLAFLTGRQVLLKPYRNADGALKRGVNLPVFLVIIAFVGARLGHLLFFEPASLAAKAFTIIFPFEFKPDFHFLGRNEFSLHAAVLAILIFLCLYRRKNISRQNSLRLPDRAFLAASVAGFFIFLGSFSNSETVGKQTSSFSGTIFMEPVARGLLKVPCCIMRTPDGKNPLVKVEVKKDAGASRSTSSRKAVILNLFFKEGASEKLVGEFLIGDVKTYLYDMSGFVHEPGTRPLNFSVFRESNGTYRARISTLGIARYPVQMFEALACLALFVFLFPFTRRDKISARPGRVFGLGMFLFWGLEFIFGFMKEDQQLVTFILNIIFCLGGLVVLFLAHRKVQTAASNGKPQNVERI